MKIERRFTRQATAGVKLEERGDDGPLKIVGYGAVFYDGTERTEYELWNNVFERIMPGAFDEAIRENDVRGLFNHNPDNLLGRTGARTMVLSVDAVGLRYEIDSGQTRVAADVVEHIRRGDLTGSSFAFRVTDERWREEGDKEIREILRVELYDTGPVTYPAYDSTTTDLRSIEDGDNAARASYEAWRADGAAVERQRVEVVARARETENRARGLTPS